MPGALGVSFEDFTPLYLDFAADVLPRAPSLRHGNTG